MRTKIKIAIAVAVVVVAVILVGLTSNSKRRIGTSQINTPSVAYKTSSNFAVAPLSESESVVDSRDSSEEGTSSGVVSQSERMIVRSGVLSVITKDVQKSVEEVSSFVTSIGGFVVSSRIEGTTNTLATLSVRVPAEKFQGTLDKAKAAGVRVTSESTTGKDVTEEFTDTQAKIKNLQASETQFMEIMKNAQKISDVLEVQRQLERVRGEIEIAQGRAQYLEKSANFSLVTMYFSVDEGQLPVVDPVAVWSPLNIIKPAFRALVGIAQWLGTLLIWLVVFIPLWIVIVLAVFLARKFVRRNTTGA